MKIFRRKSPGSLFILTEIGYNIVVEAKNTSSKTRRSLSGTKKVDGAERGTRFVVIGYRERGSFNSKAEGCCCNGR